ncbi:MAG TPA: HTH domain-containing protein [Limnobacter sp.]|uniref:helix-turn-helix transcriptional regulator n=1 Tax=Limnobacter sp. TaxID=2003368 RepID=UPI002ED8A127
MINNDRLFQIDQLIQAHGVVSKEALMKRLGVSWATLKRDLSHLRDDLHAPIVFDRAAGGYRFEAAKGGKSAKYQAKHPWFNAQETHAVLAAYQLFAALDKKGNLGPHIQPVMARLAGTLEGDGFAADEAIKRIQVDPNHAPTGDVSHFELIALALLKRQRLSLQVKEKGSKTANAVEVSPQRLVQQRNQWTLEAQQHPKGNLVGIALSTVTGAEMLETKAKNVAQKALDDAFAK